MENEKDRKREANGSNAVVPFELFAEISDGKSREHGKRDDFLDDFELCRGELIRTDTVGGNLKTVFEKGDAPAGEDDLPQRFAAVFEVAVPGEGHKEVGNGEQNDGAQGASGYRNFAPEERPRTEDACIDSSVEHKPASGRRNQKRRVPWLMNGERSDLLPCGRR